MKRGVLYAIIAVIVIAVIGGIFLFNEFYLKGGTDEASQPLTAPELSLDEDATEVAASSEAAEEAAAEADDESAEAEESAEMDESEEAAESEPDDMAADDAASAEMTSAESTGTMSVRRLYRITPDESEVMFEIDEVLLGADKHVVGTTDQVTGDIIVNLADPSSAELGTIVINARTLSTDDEFRNRALRSRILQSAQDEFEFIEFTPTALLGLPADALNTGDEITFQIVGDLQIRDIVNAVIFDATVVIAADDRLEGSATALVLRPDYNLQIPDVPSVAGVAEEVPLTITFVALEVME
ncbi:YceI family protein [Chloroflexota bacterium]